MELFRQTNIDFLRWKWWAIGASWALILLGLGSIFVQKGLRFGIDFSGGTQIALRFVSRPDIDHLRKILDSGNFGDFGIQRYEDPGKNEVLIRVQQQAKEGRDITSDVVTLLRQGLGGPIDPAKIDLNIQGRDSLSTRLVAADPDQVAGKSGVTLTDYYARVAEEIIKKRSDQGVFQSPVDANSVAGVSTAVKQWLQSNTVTGPFVLLSAENVGPQVGADLRQKALWAVATSMVGMLLYIAFRFKSLPFGVGAIIATLHDTLITVGLLSILGREFNLVVVAAILTLVGYSVNDTVVVYDRIRENQRTPKKEPLETIINRSINQTLSRTVLTSGATMLVVLAIFFLGGEVLNTFALTLIIGIIVGTYSSIYVASPIVVIWKQWTERRQPVAVPAPVKPAPAKPASASPPQGSSKKKSGRR